MWTRRHVGMRVCKARDLANLWYRVSCNLHDIHFYNFIKTFVNFQFKLFLLNTTDEI